jgi:hypothetical protein
MSSNADVMQKLALTFDTYITPFPMEDFKNYNAVTKRGTAWGNRRKTGTGVTYMAFLDGQRSCIAFRRDGPPKNRGMHGRCSACTARLTVRP